MTQRPDPAEGLERVARDATGAEADLEAAWTKAEVARRLLGRDLGPTKVGRFVVLGLAGKGAMGQVFSAYDEQLDRKVAIKVLWGREDDGARTRIRREAQALARLSHPNVVQVYEVATHRGTPVIAMEYLDGETLRSWQNRAERKPEEILAAYLAAGRGVWAAHQESLVHCDFKPENVLVEERHGGLRVKVVDFGLAQGGATPGLESTADDDSTLERLTRTGALVGTPLYMAPEQLRGEPATPASDQFALCVALAEALWARHPFDDASLESLRAAHRRGPVLPAGGTGLRARVRPVLRRGLQFEASARYPTTGALLNALGRDSGRRRRHVLVGGCAVGAVAVGGVGLGRAMDREAPCTGGELAIAATWSDERKGVIERAFLALPDGHAQSTAQRVVAGVDAFAGSWVQGHLSACEAASIRGEQSFETMDRRMLCLERARRSLGDTLAVLETQTARVLDYADDVVGQLPEVSRCADLEWIVDMDQPSVGARDAVSQARGLLVEAEALRLAGKGDLAVAKARQAETVASTVAYEPLEVEVDLGLGRALVETGAYDSARVMLADAHRTVTGDRVVERARTVVAERFSLEVVHGAFAAAEVLLPELEGASVSAHDSADLAFRRADMLHRRGDLEDSVGAYREAARGFDGVDAPLDALRTRQGLARALAELARFDEAVAEARRVVSGFEAAVGAAHPRTATARNFLADIYRQAGKPRLAEPEARRALEVMEAVRPPGHPGIGAARLTHGSALFSGGEHAQAVEVMQQAATELEAALGPEHVALASAYNNIAAALAALQRDPEALEALTRATQINRAALGDTHPQTVRARDSLASLLRRAGRLDEAEAEHQAALEAKLELYGPTHPEIAVSHAHIGALLEARGDLEAAAESFELAVDVGTASEGAMTPSVAHHQVSLGSVLVKLDRAAEAIPRLRTALTIRREQLEPHSDYVLDSLNVLGAALCAEGMQMEGRSLLEESLSISQEHEGVPSVRYDAAFSLAKCALSSRDRSRASSASQLAVSLAEGDERAGTFLSRVRDWRGRQGFAVSQARANTKIGTNASSSRR